jgi:hypothetical protein
MGAVRVAVRCHVSESQGSTTPRKLPVSYSRRPTTRYTVCVSFAELEL